MLVEICFGQEAAPDVSSADHWDDRILKHVAAGNRGPSSARRRHIRPCAVNEISPAGFQCEIEYGLGLRCLFIVGCHAPVEFITPVAPEIIVFVHAYAAPALAHHRGDIAGVTTHKGGVLAVSHLVVRPVEDHRNPVCPAIIVAGGAGQFAGGDSEIHEQGNSSLGIGRIARHLVGQRVAESIVRRRSKRMCLVVGLRQAGRGKP